MFIDARTLPAGAELDADVCIVGAGPAGIALVLERAGFGKIERRLGEEDPPVVFEGNHHHMGTTRMHPDPKRGVVDADGRLHGVSNLYVTGTSVFPTGGYINPTYTVVALAIRLADHIRATVGAA